MVTGMAKVNEINVHVYTVYTQCDVVKATLLNIYVRNTLVKMLTVCVDNADLCLTGADCQAIDS